MFDELKKKFGFGSSAIPATEPEPTPEPEPPKPEPETEGAYHRRRMQKKKLVAAMKREADEKEWHHADTLAGIAGSSAPINVTINRDMDLAAYSSKLAEAKHAFKTGLSTDEMSRAFKDMAHGPDDGISMTFGTKTIRPEFMMDASKLTMFGSDGKPVVEIGELSAAPMHTGGFVGKIHPGAYITGAGTGKSITESLAEIEEQKRKQKEDAETSEMKRLTKSFVQGVGEEMTNSIASAHVRGEACEFTGEVLKRLIVAAAANGINIHELLEEVEMTEEEKTKEALALEALARAVTEYWASPDYELDQTQFSLSGPVSLTILRAPSESHKSGYGKKAHIGGEEFIGEKAYLGKRGQIICCFKPVGVEDYTVMEMPLGDCFAQLTGFQKHFVENGFSAQFQAIRDAKNQEKQAADLEKFSSSYADFGSF